MPEHTGEGKFYWIAPSKKGWIMDSTTNKRVITDSAEIAPREALDNYHFGTLATYTALTQNQGLWIAKTVALNLQPSSG